MELLHRFFLLLIIASALSSCHVQSNRKDLREREDGQTLSLHTIHTNRIDPSRVFQLSWQPRVFLYRNFLSDVECDHLISLAQGAEDKSSGNDDDSKNTTTNKLLSEDHIVERIEERISIWTFLPKENSKTLKVVRFGLEETERKFDYETIAESNEPLMATVVLYLSNVSRGGGIFFPDSKVEDMVLSGCKESSRNILKPIKGNAVLFFSVHNNASHDKTSSHSRCLVLEGEMWWATKAFHLRAEKNLVAELDSEKCTDEDENCPGWAAIGECQRNPVFMAGSPDYYGSCRKSCNVC